MNKLMGFFELKNSNLPTIQWEEFTNNTVLDDSMLWTIRTAVLKGNDLSLPRSVGEDAVKSSMFAREMLRTLGDNGMVIYYPYFIAKKSGTLHVFSDAITIEAVNEDLWNLVTYSDREVTIRINGNNTIYDGNKSFLPEDELKNLLDQVPKIRALFRDHLLEGKSILLEWSYAYNCNLNKEPIGDQYLVFYEARTV